jgi:gamma-glutamyltranspeptidase/glutathione hydrolase
MTLEFISIGLDLKLISNNIIVELKRIAKTASKDFYQGKTAELLITQMHKSDSIITVEDLRSYEAVWREPLRANWRE